MYCILQHMSCDAAGLCNDSKAFGLKQFPGVGFDFHCGIGTSPIVEVLFRSSVLLAVHSVHQSLLRLCVPAHKLAFIGLTACTNASGLDSPKGRVI